MATHSFCLYNIPLCNVLLQPFSLEMEPVFLILAFVVCHETALASGPNISKQILAKGNTVCFLMEEGHLNYDF